MFACTSQVTRATSLKSHNLNGTRHVMHDAHCTSQRCRSCQTCFFSCPAGTRQARAVLRCQTTFAPDARSHAARTDESRVFFSWNVQVIKMSNVIPRRCLRHCAARWAEGRSPKPILTIAMSLPSAMMMVTLMKAVQQLLLLRPLRLKKCQSQIQP